MDYITLKAPAGATSLKFGDREIMVEDGFIEVPSAEMAAAAKAHGYTDPLAPPAAVSASSADPNVVSIPRVVFLAGMKDLGISLVDGIPADKLVTAFREGCARQAERLTYELNAAAARQEDAMTAAVEAAEKRGADRALEQLAAAPTATTTEPPPAPAPPSGG